MVRYLLRLAQAMNLKVAVISRGYGGNYRELTRLSPASSSSELVGDEMAMQYAYCQRQGLTGVEFIVARQRLQAALFAQELGVDLIIADDGMQHYCLPRTKEIAVIGPRGLGNEKFIPAGPLRESPSRLQSVDLIINNSLDEADKSLGGTAQQQQRNLWFMLVKAISPISAPSYSIETSNSCSDSFTNSFTESSVSSAPFTPLSTNSSTNSSNNNSQRNSLSQRIQAHPTPGCIEVSEFVARNPKVIALCAIGYPQGFKTSLEKLGLEVVQLWSFADHHQFKQGDIDQIYHKHPEYQNLPLLMTEKDAIKCKDLNFPASCYFLEREGYFDDEFVHKLEQMLTELSTKPVTYKS